MSGDTVLIQDAIGEKVGKFTQLVSTFLGGFVVAMSRGWLLTLVMLTFIVPVVIVAGVVSKFMSRMASRKQIAYAKAASIAEQMIGSIRTDVSFTGERRAVAKYNESLVNAYKSSIREGLAAGLGLGTVILVFC